MHRGGCNSWPRIRFGANPASLTANQPKIYGSWV